MGWEYGRADSRYSKVYVSIRRKSGEYRDTAAVFSRSESVAISYLRAISVLLIIVCHICQSYDTGWEYILNIGVQIFFILSGLLHGLYCKGSSFSLFKYDINVFAAVLLFIVCTLLSVFILNCLSVKLQFCIGKDAII